MKKFTLLALSSVLIMSSSLAQEKSLSQELAAQLAPTIYSNNGLSSSEVINAYQTKVKLFNLEADKADKFQAEVLKNNLEEKLTQNQFLVIADRNPKNQIATLAYWNNDTKKLETYGYTKVSTGSVRAKHFYTPLGWFQNLPANGSYRAQGTKNENGIRGYGKKGMRVWDFGWVPSTSGYKKGLNIDIRFQMHATDPDYLESRLGTPDSQGCVRIHQSFNQFLDIYGILDAEYEKENNWVLRKDRIKIQDAGTYLLVVDTGK